MLFRSKALSLDDAEDLSERLRALVVQFADEIGLAWDAPPELPALDTHDKQRLIAFSQIAARGRSSVTRDHYSHEIIQTSVGEYPIRIGRAFGQLLRALRYIGVDDDDAWRVVRKCALDSLPGNRRLTLLALLQGHGRLSAISESMNVSQATARRSLEELKIHHLVDRTEGAGWAVSGWTKERLREALNGTPSTALKEASGW